MQRERVSVLRYREDDLDRLASLNDDKVAGGLKRGREIQLQRAGSVRIHVVRAGIRPRNYLIGWSVDQRILSGQCAISIELVIATNGERLPVIRQSDHV